jgi:glycerophosphoryl diester phosphodiesterase
VPRCRIAFAAALVAALLSGCEQQGTASAPPEAPRSSRPSASAPIGTDQHSEPPAARPVTAVAHRGAVTATTSENGLPALQLADELGAEMAEFDVRPTLDQGLGVMHDGGLARTTDCQGQMWSRTLADLQAHCRLADGTAVPSLQEYVDLARSARLPLMIELKEGPGWTAALLGDLRASLEPLDDWKGSVFLSFDEHLLDLARAAVPELPGIWIVPRRSSAAVAVLDKPVGGFLVDGELTTAPWVARAHRDGKLVYARVVDTTRGWRRCHEIGLDGILTNRLAAYLRWRGRLSG